MDNFIYNAKGELLCEQIKVEDIAEAIGTPTYIYSLSSFKDHYLRFKQAFSELNPLICFSIKTCNNIQIIKELVALGSGMDVVSGGELFLADKAGVDMSKVVYAGIGKTDKEIELAIDKKIGLFNIESEEEFQNLSRIAESKKSIVYAALRINPDVVDKDTHEKTKTGYRGSKFGVDIDKAEQFFASYGNDPYVKLEGVHIHIGSPIYDSVVYGKAITVLLEFVDKLKAEGYSIKFIDIGGGYSADYATAMSPSWSEYAKIIVPLLKPYVDRGVKIIIEPGRTISANTAILLAKILYTKTGGDKNFLILDTGMHHLIRPALYDGYHFMWPVKVDPSYIPNQRQKDMQEMMPELKKYDIVGPICESSDYLAKDRNLPPLSRGDMIAIYTCGAYGMVMSSNYNAMPRPAEVLVNRNELHLIRERETYEDLIYKTTEKKKLI